MTTTTLTQRYDTGDYFGALLRRYITDTNQHRVEIHASYDGFIRRDFFTRSAADEYVQDMIAHNFYIDPHDHTPTLIEEWVTPDV